MLTHPTLDQMRALKLDGMAQAFLSSRPKTAPRISITPSGWRCCLMAKPPAAPPGASRAECARRIFEQERIGCPLRGI